MCSAVIVIPLSYIPYEDFKDRFEVSKLTFELLSLGLHPNPVVNCLPGVSHAARGINACAIIRTLSRRTHLAVLTVGGC